MSLTGILIDYEHIYTRSVQKASNLFSRNTNGAHLMQCGESGGGGRGVGDSNVHT